MEYSIRELAELSGVSSRTLRYYDSIGLLKPARVNDVGYRFYGEKEMILLQQIFFYRERGFSLEEIRQILYQKDFDLEKALWEHLQELETRQKETANMIKNVKCTIASMKGEREMSEKERFEGFKQRIVEENEAVYGKEVREKYGDAEMDAANRKLLSMTEADYERFENLKEEVEQILQKAVLAGEDPQGEMGRRVVLLHKEWLGMTWKQYTENAHKGVVQMYVLDERFKAYYDKEVEGCAAFLRDAVLHWVEKM